MLLVPVDRLVFPGKDGFQCRLLNLHIAIGAESQECLIHLRRFVQNFRPLSVPSSAASSEPAHRSRTGPSGPELLSRSGQLNKVGALKVGDDVETLCFDRDEGRRILLSKLTKRIDRVFPRLRHIIRCLSIARLCWCNCLAEPNQRDDSMFFDSDESIFKWGRASSVELIAANVDSSHDSFKASNRCITSFAIPSGAPSWTLIPMLSSPGLQLRASGWILLIDKVLDCFHNRLPTRHPGTLPYRHDREKESTCEPSRSGASPAVV
ncbi:hypothetical protein KC345_g139 [Hortaea werneckii]|nr:hypothetical protein KC345_g139 [Hortaea werneckii]